MDTTALEDRIQNASDDNPTIHALYRTGSDESITYYLVIATKTYEGREMLKIRYFALNKGAPADDTWMQNGITARGADALLARLASDLPAINAGVTDGDETIGHDLTNDIEE